MFALIIGIIAVCLPQRRRGWAIWGIVLGAFAFLIAVSFTMQGAA